MLNSSLLHATAWIWHCVSMFHSFIVDFKPIHSHKQLSFCFWVWYTYIDCLIAFFFGYSPLNVYFYFRRTVIWWLIFCLENKSRRLYKQCQYFSVLYTKYTKLLKMDINNVFLFDKTSKCLQISYFLLNSMNTIGRFDCCIHSGDSLKGIHFRYVYLIMFMVFRSSNWINILILMNKIDEIQKKLEKPNP